MVSDTGRGRILFVLGSLTVGGTETQLALLAEGLKTRGWVIDVFPLASDSCASGFPRRKCRGALPTENTVALVR